MGKIVVVKPGNTAVKLPSGNFNQSEQTTLTDAEYAALGTTAMNALTVVASGVAEPARSPSNPVSLIDAVNQSIVLGNSTYSFATAAFLPNHAYKANQFVTYGGLFYAANVDFTSSTTFSASNWTPIGGGSADTNAMHYKGDWVGGSYALNDVVRYNKQLWTPKSPISGTPILLVGTAASVNTLGLTLPSGCVAGDIVIGGSASFNITNMSSNGWNIIQQMNGFSGDGFDYHSMGYYVLTGTDITNGITPAWGQAGDTSAVGFVIRNITSASIVTAQSAQDLSGTHTPSVTPTLDSWVIEFVGSQGGPPVLSGPANNSTTGTPSSHMTTVMAYETITAGSTYPQRTYTGAANACSAAVPVSLPTQWNSSLWTKLADQDAVTNGVATAKGDLLVATGAGAVVRIAVGSNGQVLAADSTQTAGVKWAAANNITPNTQTGTTYTPVLGDAGLVVEMNNAAANTLTVPPNSSVAFPIGTVIKVCQLGAGTTTIAAGAGVTIQAVGATLTTSGQYATVALRQRAANIWVLSSSS